MWIVGMLAAGAVGAVVLASCTVDKDGLSFEGQAGASGGGVGGATAPNGSTKAGGAGVSACDPAPCLHGGKCTDLDGGRYQCACSPGYGGTRCEIDIDDCAVDRCKNGGACADRINDYECQCSVGYEGKNCELPKDDCTGMPCQNGGTCVDGTARFTCVCQAGFSGLTCERTVSGCDDAPCLNGACSDLPTGYTCACADGFTGNNCEIDIDECLEQPCKNDGECIDGVNARTCRCKAGTGGPDCASDVDECAANPCRNGGECTNGSPGFECRCPPEWTGKTCDLDVDECASAGACPADRACVNEAGGHECPCAPGGVGPDCERVFDILPAVEQDRDCTALDVSADGSVVVGWCTKATSSGLTAYRWSESSGLEILEGLPNPGPRAVSDDGSVIAGTYDGGPGDTVFRWTRSTGMVAIGLSGTASMNADGSVIAAGSGRWTASGIQDITPLIDADALSGDGNVIVGPGPHGQGSYRWTPSSVVELERPSGATFIAAAAITTDGSMVVGRLDINNAVTGIIWNGTEVISGNGMPLLAAVSGDGSVIVTANPAGLWDRTQGVRDLRQLLNAKGAAIPESKLFAFAISRDGRYVIGEIQIPGEPHRGYRAKLP
jgi:hypothetical protein